MLPQRLPRRITRCLQPTPCHRTIFGGPAVSRRQRFGVLPPSLSQINLRQCNSAIPYPMSTVLAKNGCLFHSGNVQWADAATAPAAASDDNGATVPAETPAYAKPPLASTQPKHQLSRESREKVERIFQKILWLDMVEAGMLLDQLNRQMGITITEKQRERIEKICDAEVDQMEGNVGGSTGDEGQDGEGDEAAADAAPKLVEVKLTSFDAKSKIKVIKEVRAIAGLGLKEAKELVESLPKVIQKGLKPEQAEELKTKLEAVGGTVEIE